MSFKKDKLDLSLLITMCFYTYIAFNLLYNPNKVILIIAAFLIFAEVVLIKYSSDDEDS